MKIGWTLVCLTTALHVAQLAVTPVDGAPSATDLGRCEVCEAVLTEVDEIAKENAAAASRRRANEANVSDALNTYCGFDKADGRADADAGTDFFSSSRVILCISTIFQVLSLHTMGRRTLSIAWRTTLFHVGTLSHRRITRCVDSKRSNRESNP